ncbi:MAG: hypothetical protein OHK0022_03440 [Roseiflexaceae bacterium]
MTSLPYETLLGDLDGDSYIAVQLVLRRSPTGDSYYCPLTAWTTTPAAQLIDRDRQIVWLRQLVDQAIAERDSAQVQAQQQVEEAQAKTANAVKELADVQASVQRAIAAAQPTPAPRAETPEGDRPRAERVECPECGKKFWQKQLAEHRYYQHDVPMEQPELPPVPPPASVACPTCSAQFLDEELLAKHQASDCSRTRRPQPRQRAPAELVLTTDRPWTCASCQSSAYTRSVTRPELCMRCAAAPAHLAA